ncbi:MAG: rhomboid family intramembrane serine protease [Bacteroidales bacterium]|nr:rhomboid family intramembrane serine protease [Bacteroidales bacterium]
MSYYRPSGFSLLTPVVKNLILINIVCFVISSVGEYMRWYDTTSSLGLHYLLSPSFRPVQFITYMFLHGNLEHIFFNMLALWMFGNTLETYWGSKKFLIYYFATGIGAGIFQMIVAYIHLKTLNIDNETLDIIVTQGDELLRSGRNWIDSTIGNANLIINGPTVGASGAIFGLLMAFGMLFPNEEIYIYFAFPIKAKWFVLFYGLIELFSGLRNSAGDNTAHFAHLGGMIFGYILLKYWQKHGTNFN